MVHYNSLNYNQVQAYLQPYESTYKMPTHHKTNKLHKIHHNEEDTPGRLVTDSCDTYATTLHDFEIFLHQPTYHMTAFLKYQNKIITAEFLKFFIGPIQTQQYLQYLATKCQRNKDTTQNIDWDAIKKHKRISIFMTKSALTNSLINGEPQTRHFSKQKQ